MDERSVSRWKVHLKDDMCFHGVKAGVLTPASSTMMVRCAIVGPPYFRRLRDGRRICQVQTNDSSIPYLCMSFSSRGSSLASEGCAESILTLVSMGSETRMPSLIRSSVMVSLR